MRERFARLVVLVVPVLAGCGTARTEGSPASDAAAETAIDTGAESEAGDVVDGGTASPDPALTTLPIGDAKYLPNPKRGYVFSCQQTFGGIGGASVDGPWIDMDAGTFDFTSKVVVQGAITWDGHAFDVKLAGATRTITGNGLPNHPTGTYPIAKTDPAYAYDQNPNTIKAQTLSWALPATPAVATVQTCLDGGPIGILLTGSVFFDALDGEGRDAVAHETQDVCQAHPERSGEYHYHSVSDCIADPGSGHSALMGYARDGFGIYGLRGEDGKRLTNADLDECHGHTHLVEWDGATVSLYHYHATYEFPYTLGCFKGAPIAVK